MWLLYASTKTSLYIDEIVHFLQYHWPKIWTSVYPIGGKPSNGGF